MLQERFQIHADFPGCNPSNPQRWGAFKRRDFSNRVEFSHLPFVKPQKAMEVLKPGEDENSRVVLLQSGCYHKKHHVLVFSKVLFVKNILLLTSLDPYLDLCKRHGMKIHFWNGWLGHLSVASDRSSGMENCDITRRHQLPRKRCASRRLWFRRKHVETDLKNIEKRIADDCCDVLAPWQFVQSRSHSQPKGKKTLSRHVELDVGSRWEESTGRLSLEKEHRLL